MTIKSKGAVLFNMESKRPYFDSMPLKISNLIIDPPGANEVLIKIRAAGLCHSDLSVIDGNRPRPLPMLLGHEASGEIIQLGKGVNRFEVGDHVVFAFLPSCGDCQFCKSGRAALCEPGAKANNDGTLIGGNRRIKLNGEYINHHLGVSGFSEYAVGSVDSIVKIDKDVPFEIAALFGCAVLTGVGSIVNSAKLKFGQTILVIGLGGVGLAAILGAKAAGASKIIAADINPKKREIAKSFGANYVIDSSDKNSLNYLKDITGGGVDISVEFAGAISALEFAFNATKRGGTTVTAALPNPEARLKLSPVTLVGQEKTIKGSYLGGCIPSIDIPAYIELYKSGRLQVEKLISHRIKLSEVNQAFDRLASGEGIRQIIIFD